jgi:glycosyltransferase involved in cell wall biosynthesis
MDISVASICKNEEIMIRPWLRHLLEIDAVKEINLVDTGSTDNTLDLIKDIKDSRIKIHTCDMNNSFSSARNFALTKVNKDAEWLLFIDVDELFSDCYENLFAMMDGIDFSDTDVIRFPFVKFWDFDKLWFHTPPILPCLKDGNVFYGASKDTIALFRKGVVKEFTGELHERLQLTSQNPREKTISIKKDMRLESINDLREDVFVGHYSKAKLHEQARKQGKSFEYCVGKKRMEFRKCAPATYFGRTYDRAWCETATETDIEQLGKDQIAQFVEVEGHTFVDDFDAYELNNEFIKDYFPRRVDA